MPVINRKVGESIQCGPVTITVEEVRGKSRVRLRVVAPDEMPISRVKRLTPAAAASVPELEETISQLDQGD